MRKIKILQRGNFYFPLRDWKKKIKFEVIDTVTVAIKTKTKKKELFLWELPDLIWKELKKEYKNEIKKYDYAVPVSIHFFKDKALVHIDLLKIAR